MGSGGRPQWLLLLFFSALLLFSFRAYGDGDAGIVIRFLESPRAFSSSATAAFEFEVLDGGSGNSCDTCSVECKLDDQGTTNCQSGKVYYAGLPDGGHMLEICAKGSRGVSCSGYNWTVDTVSPTAYVSALSPFTSAENVSINVSFSEPCTGGGGFRCSISDCNLLVYGSGQVLPSSLKVLQLDLKYSLIVNIPPDVEYGRLVVVMDKNFCRDKSGNLFRRTAKSSIRLHFDRRNVSVDVKTRIAQKLIQINRVPRTVEATNDDRDLRVYVNFSVPVVNSSSEILRALRTTAGVLVPTNRSSLGNRRFVKNVSRIAIVSLSLEAMSIISRQGTPVSLTEPVTFLYDSERPSVTLSTSSGTRTRDDVLPILVKFVKPVFGFNSSVSIFLGELYGGNFREVSRSIYVAEIHADEDVVSLNVLDNKTVDVAGNLNLASNILRVRHYSIPTISSIFSGVMTFVFGATCVVAAVLAVSTASLLSAGVLRQQSSYFISEPSRNLMRVAFHIQVFAQSRWLGVTLPIEYYEFARGCSGASPTSACHGRATMFLGTPNQGMKPEATSVLASQNPDGWREFGRNMFWLAIIVGGLQAVRAIVLLALKLRRKEPPAGEKNYGALTFPRFELFLVLLAIPCITQASTAIIIHGHSAGGTAVGILFLGIVCSVMAVLLVFISLGISMGRLLQYKEVHQVGKEFHWYQEIIRWTWNEQVNSPWLTKLGPLFEDLRGPPKYMLSQITAAGRKRGGSIIDSDDETEDAEAPFLQKLFGILRIYYPVLETVKRVAVAAVAGAAAGRRRRLLTLVVLSLASFQLFFLVLKKPFIKKKAQLAEILAVAAEVAVFGFCLALLQGDFSDAGEQRVGISMAALVAGSFFAQMVKEWYALWKQVRRLSHGGDSFFSGLRVAVLGLLLFVFPSSSLKGFDGRLSSPVGGGDGAARESSGVGERPWLRQLREMAKASFSRDDAGSGSARTCGGASGGKRSGSSSITSSLDSKARPRALEKDLETIFSSR
ncbi:unnamed protein product [Spirodela intermedia]|uniref:Uncharacterized protein n=1 Tax=Spirodela intermedia TaxID=51605 RepID=A0A7I8JTJ4_SPIIN|nr:unnamed protein product [Spirodela intermedia]CAA6673081.1 unnamed protein product [Spirodela intermedia]